MCEVESTIETMRNTNHTQNKLLILARRVWELTNDPDLSFRKIASSFNLSSGTLSKNYAKYKHKYDLGVAFKVEKKKR